MVLIVMSRFSVLIGMFIVIVIGVIEVMKLIVLGSDIDFIVVIVVVVMFVVSCFGLIGMLMRCVM